MAEVGIILLFVAGLLACVCLDASILYALALGYGLFLPMAFGSVTAPGGCLRCL